MPIDYTKYPPNWESEIVPRILKRAGDRCEHCHVENRALMFSIPLRIVTRGVPKDRLIWVSELRDAVRLKRLMGRGEIKPVRVVLTVAHLDHDETNHDVDDSRLMAMCEYCHLNYHANEKYRRACAKKEPPA